MRAVALFGLILALNGSAPVSLIAERGARPHCRYGDRGRLLDSVRVASYPTAADAQAYYDAWIEFYEGFYVFPPFPLVKIDYGFDTYKVTYCTIDALLPVKRVRNRRSPLATCRSLGNREGFRRSCTCTARPYPSTTRHPTRTSLAIWPRTARASRGRCRARSSPEAVSSTSLQTTLGLATRRCPVIATSTPPPRRLRQLT